MKHMLWAGLTFPLSIHVHTASFVLRGLLSRPSCTCLQILAHLVESLLGGSGTTELVHTSSNALDDSVIRIKAIRASQ
jgi:hypothetical protein